MAIKLNGQFYRSCVALSLSAHAAYKTATHGWIGWTAKKRLGRERTGRFRAKRPSRLMRFASQPAYTSSFLLNYAFCDLAGLAPPPNPFDQPALDAVRSSEIRERDRIGNDNTMSKKTALPRHGEEWCFSVADVSAYWRKPKQKLGGESSEIVPLCHGLKLEETPRRSASIPIFY